MTQTLELSFCGERGGHAPTTWGQRAIWELIEFNRPHDSRFRLRTLYEVPDGISLDRILAVLRGLAERHESLRTTFVREPDGPPTQLVHREGSFPIRIVEAGSGFGRSGADEYTQRFLCEGYDPTVEWPVRLAVFVQHGQPRLVASSVTHLATDMMALRILTRDFAGLLGGDADGRGRTSHQPLDQAAYEQSAEGRAVLQRAVEAWRSRLAVAPRTLFRTPLAGYAGPRYPAFNVYAKGLGAHAQSIADNLDVHVATVFVAATAAMLAKAAGADRAALILECSNRTAAQTLNYVGTLTQPGLIPVETLGTSFYDLVRRVWSKLQDVHRSSRYDPAALDAMFAGIADSDGPSLDHAVNVVQDTTPIPFPGDAAGLEDGDTLCERDTPLPLTWLHFGLQPRTDGQNAVLRIWGDQRYMPEDAMVFVAKGVNDLVRDAAARDVNW